MTDAGARAAKPPPHISQTHKLIVEFRSHQMEKMKDDILSAAGAATKGIYTEKKTERKIDIPGVNKSHVIYP